MKKYLQLFLVSFILMCMVFTKNYNVYFFIFIPVSLYLIYVKRLYFIPILITSLVNGYFNQDLISLALIITIVLSFTLSFLLKKSHFLMFVNLTILSVSNLLFLYYMDIVNNFYVLLMLYILSSAFFIALLFDSKIYEKRVHYLNHFYIDSILFFAGMIGLASHNLYLSFALVLMYIYYLSAYKMPIYSFIISIAFSYLFYFVYDLDIGLFLPISALLSLLNYSGILFYISIAIFNLVTEKPFDLTYQLAIISSGIMFEFIRFFFIKKKISLYTVSSVYQDMVDNVNSQIISYATFLDEFIKSFIENKDFSLKEEKIFKQIYGNYCENCAKKHVCFKEKSMLYKYIKLILDSGKNFVYEPMSVEFKNFINGCLYLNEILKESNALKDKYRLDMRKLEKEKIMEKQITGVSTILRRYAIELNKNNEGSVENVYAFKRLLLNARFPLLMFEVKIMNNDSLLIEIGLKKANTPSLELIIESFANRAFNLKTKVIFNKGTNDYSYYYVTNKLNYKINYGCASLAKDGTNVSGDNSLIKDLPNGKFIACISDGMGSGYYAWNESVKTLKLIDDITSSNLSSNSSINILNTFYSLKDQMEIYASLDYIEINKISGEANLYKLGTTDTYIVKKDSTLNKINNEYLPFGIEDLIMEKSIFLEDEDLIILFSDGIIEKVSHINQFEQFIRLISTKNPQVIATDIINYLLKQMNNVVDDDMSLIVLKVEKKIYA